MGLTVQGLDKAIDRLTKVANRIGDPAPVFVAFSDWVNRERLSSFEGSRSFTGTPLKPLAEATLRTSGLPRVKGRIKAVSRKPLIKTGEAKNTGRLIPLRDGVESHEVGHLVPHLVGASVPLRNPTAFQKRNGRWVMVKRASEKLHQLLRNYVNEGVAR